MAKLFSIKQQYSKKIFLKEKLVEFRRQNVNVSKNEICLIYTSSPKRKIEGYFIVQKKIRLPLKELWKKTRKLAGINLEEFMNYFEGCDIGTAIIFESVEKTKITFTLEELREFFGDSFRPPQSYCNLDGELSKLINLVVQ